MILFYCFMLPGGGAFVGLILFIAVCVIIWAKDDDPSRKVAPSTKSSEASTKWVTTVSTQFINHTVLPAIVSWRLFSPFSQNTHVLLTRKKIDGMQPPRFLDTFWPPNYYWSHKKSGCFFSKLCQKSTLQVDIMLWIPFWNLAQGVQISICMYNYQQILYIETHSYFNVAQFAK